jgi:hypothetical protein
MYQAFSALFQYAIATRFQFIAGLAARAAAAEPAALPVSTLCGFNPSRAGKSVLYCGGFGRGGGDRNCIPYF